jgi:hypothetical protein
MVVAGELEHLALRLEERCITEGKELMTSYDEAAKEILWQAREYAEMTALSVDEWIEHLTETILA